MRTPEAESVEDLLPRVGTAAFSNEIIEIKAIILYNDSSTSDPSICPIETVEFEKSRHDAPPGSRNMRVSDSQTTSK